MGLPKDIENLIERFDRNREAYLSGQYNETQLRREFLDPFFTALGWDVENKQGYAEAYKDVIHEDALKIGGATKAPDYCFRIGGGKKFFVEAKKPSFNLKDDISPAFQLRRYAWSAKFPLSILTDFEEFRFYDASVKPDERKPDEGLLLELKYSDYLKNAEKLWEFSKERVAAGSLEAMLPRDRRTQRLRIPVDEAFLDQLPHRLRHVQDRGRLVDRHRAAAGCGR